MRKRWSEARPHYERFAEHVRDKLKADLFRQGINCEVTCRCKEVASLLKKQIIKNYADPWKQITDKAGVRVVTPYETRIPEIEAVIRRSFDVQKREDKEDDREYDRLGYRGVHFEVCLLPGTDEYEGMQCEIQLHTSAGHLWSATSHDLAYKANEDIPNDIKRRLYRLVALTELFDAEVTACRDAIMNLPNHEEVRLLSELERFFFPLASRDYNKALSLEIISELKPLYDPTELTEFDALMSEFVARHGEKLRGIYDQYKNDGRHLMLFQPESLMIFERAEHDPFELLDRWDEYRPPQLVRDLVTSIWGVAA